MLDCIKKDRWSAYLVGLLMGLLVVAVFNYGNQIGASSGVARVSALIENAVAPSMVGEQSYFEKLLADNTLFSRRILFTVGTLLGALIATRMSTEQRPPQNTVWIRAFGNSNIKRYIAAFAGGILLMIGARIANGCTSGHVISGGAQLAVVSWVFATTLFAVGIPTAYLLYRKR